MFDLVFLFSGALVCDTCSSSRVLLVNIDQNKAVRVCNNCAQDLQKKK